MKTQRRSNYGFISACVLIFAVASLAVVSILRFMQSSDWVLHSMHVRAELDELSTSLLTAQNNVRGFHLSGQDFYLNDYNRAITEIPVILDRISQLTIDNPSQQSELARLRETVKTRMDRWKTFITVRREQGLHTIEKLMQKEEGKLLDASVRGSIGKMRATEASLLEDRIRFTQNLGKIALSAVIFGSFLAIVLTATAAFLSARSLKRRDLAEAERDRFFTLSLDMLCISGMDGYFKRLSPSFQETLGFPLEELYARPILEFVHPDDIQKTIDEIERQAGGQKVLSFENRYLCKDGTYKILSWKSVPVDGLMYAVARDVTQQKVFESELIEARNLAHSAARAKAEFLANMSHEIRTPLNGIIGMTDLMSGTLVSDEQNRFLGVIRSSGMHLLKIVNEILDFSKIEAGKLAIEILDFNLASLIEMQLSLVGPKAFGKNLKLISEIDPKIPQFLKGDAGRIGQILLNLLANAVKFTEQGSVTLRVKLLSSENEMSRLCFEVEDTGIGLSKEQISQLFAPFTQADGSTARRFGGTGLGLSISKRLVEMMGGEIGASGEQGKSATFWFTLNLARGSSESMKTLSNGNGHKKTFMAHPSSPLTAAPTRTLNVLVAEDNPVNQMIIMKMLSKLGHTAQLVGNGREAIDAFEAAHRVRPFDMILMDQHMPEMDGVQATRRIREIETQTGNRIPILAFTANVLEDDQAACFSAGMDDFLLKPVTLDTLKTALTEWSQV